MRIALRNRDPLSCGSAGRGKVPWLHRFGGDASSPDRRQRADAVSLTGRPFVPLFDSNPAFVRGSFSGRPAKRAGKALQARRPLPPASGTISPSRPSWRFLRSRRVIVAQAAPVRPHRGMVAVQRLRPAMRDELPLPLLLRPQMGRAAPGAMPLGMVAAATVVQQRLPRLVAVSVAEGLAGHRGPFFGGDGRRIMPVIFPNSESITSASASRVAG